MQIIRFPGGDRKRSDDVHPVSDGESGRLVMLESAKAGRARLPKGDGDRERRQAGILPLVLEDVHHVVNRVALLRNISFRLPAGRRTVVLGYNGAGKSLLLRLCHGLIRPTSGALRWEGALGGSARQVALRQAMVFQRPVLLRRSVWDNLLFVLKNRGIRGDEARQRVARALKLCGLERLAGRAAKALSGGEQQKLALARAWLLRPEVLFLDEPAASLDPAATLELEALIDHMHRAGATIVFSTHDMAQARRLAEHVLFVHNGLLLEDSSAEAFFEQPRTPEARAFLKGDLMP